MKKSHQPAHYPGLGARFYPGDFTSSKLIATNSMTDLTYTEQEAIQSRRPEGVADGGESHADGWASEHLLQPQDVEDPGSIPVRHTTAACLEQDVVGSGDVEARRGGDERPPVEVTIRENDNTNSDHDKVTGGQEARSLQEEMEGLVISLDDDVESPSYGAGQ